MSDQGGAAVDDDDRLVEFADRLRYTIRIEDTNECMCKSGPNESKARRVGRGGVSAGRAGSGAKQHTLASLTDRRASPRRRILGPNPTKRLRVRFLGVSVSCILISFLFFFLFFLAGFLSKNQTVVFNLFELLAT